MFHCLHAQASELHCSSASKWNSFLSAFPDCTIYQQSYGTKQFFTEINLASLCLGAALQLIKSVKSVCGLILATIFKKAMTGNACYHDINVIIV